MKRRLDEALDVIERHEAEKATIKNELSDDLPGMMALIKGVSEQRFPHTMDAAVWAAEFVKLNPGADEGMMLSWFANAIMAGYDTAQHRVKAEKAADVLAEREACARVCDARSDEHWKSYKTIGPFRGDSRAETWGDEAEECAKAIRARTGGKP